MSAAVWLEDAAVGSEGSISEEQYDVIKLLSVRKLFHRCGPAPWLQLVRSPSATIRGYEKTRIATDVPHLLGLLELNSIENSFQLKLQTGNLLIAPQTL